MNILSQITVKESEHRNQNILLCSFPYNPNLITSFKKQFPSAKWSRTKNAWYLIDNTLNRNRLNFPLKQVGYKAEEYIHQINQIAYQNFRNALIQKVFSPNTIKTYLNEFSQLLIILKNHSVNTLSTNKLNSYFLYCIKTLKHSENQVYSRMNAVKCYFKLVLNNEQIFTNVIRPKAPKTLPTVLSTAELKNIFLQTQNLKHLLLLKMSYGMGLRVSELINLKVMHIDLDRMQVLIKNAKGKKDRYVNFPKSLLIIYNDYLRAYQPKQYLFEGQFQQQYTTRSAQAVFNTCLKKAGITKRIGIHGLRHSYATHLLEAGTDMVFIQKLLGHNHIKTTEIYAKVSQKTLGKISSPLDNL
ncbi:MAG: tyrosine-type recombinase/integrase [Bacteroidia bacterium]|nr:tyrosine-type recombinase/integrase [Bacteroidia bacterium]